MYLQRYYLECLSHASCMVADEKTKQAAVIDPQRDIDIYLQDANEHGFKIKWVILTHFHTDFVAGHIELRDQVGAEIVLGAKAEAEFAHVKMGDGDSIEFGQVRLEALETPGHMPEGLTILAYDLSKEAPIVIIAEGDRVSESIMRLGRIGFDHVAGYLNDGLDSLADRPELIQTTKRITVPAVGELKPAPIVIDVRTEKEWHAGHIDGSLNVPLNHLEELLEKVPSDRDVIVHCEGGYRSSTATSILQKYGLYNVTDLVGGYKAWVQAGQSVIGAA